MTFAERFKNKEFALISTLPSDSIVGVRLDGKAFHTFTKQFARPFDMTFMSGMDSAATYVLERVFPSALFAYVQSDEISVVFTDQGKETAQLPLGGRLEKILSISASAASIGLIRALPFVKGDPLFDSRAFILDDMSDVADYVDWRRLDARKNAISMAAETLKSHKELLGVSTRERAEMLKGTPLEVLPEMFMNGRIIVKENYEADVSFVDRRTGETKNITATRSRWVTHAAERDFVDNFFNSFKNE